MRFKEFYQPKNGIRPQWLKDKIKRYKEDFFNKNGFYQEDKNKYPNKGNNQLRDMYISI